MRVTHISIIHRALDNRIFEKECRTLAADGYEVHVVAAGPPGREKDSVRLHSLSSSTERPRLRRQWTRQLRAARHALRLRPSVFHIHDPHLIPLGLVLKALGSPVIYDVHEDYPAHARTKLAHRPRHARAKALLWRCLEAVARRGFDGFVCASPALARCFPAGHSTAAANYPRHRELAPDPSDGAWLPYRDRPNTICYTGSITRARGWWETAGAFELLPEPLDARLLVVGEFRERGLAEAAHSHRSWQHVDFEPWRTHPLLVRALHGVRAGVIVLQRHPNHLDADRSNKLFEYMAAGLPVIASDLPSWREIVAGAECGLLVDPIDAPAVADAIEYLLTHPEEAEAMGRRGQAAVAARFNWDSEAERLLGLYRSVAGAPSPALVPQTALEPDMAA